MADSRVLTIYLVACVKTKQQSSAPAKDLYTSSWFKLARQYVESTGCRWYILSAEYGLLEPDTRIAPYERTLGGAADRRTWAEKVKTQLAPLPLEGAKVVVLAGRKYRDALLPYLASRGASVEIPMEGVAWGKQRQWLRRQVTSMPAVQEPVGGIGEADKEARARVTEALLRLTPEIRSSDLFPTLEAGAAEFVAQDPYAFLLAASLDRGVPAEVIWTIPYWLYRQWGHLDPHRVRAMSNETLSEALQALPRGPRYVSAAPRTIQELTRIVVDEFNGNARALWHGRSRAAFRQTFESVYGVGPGIANMTVQLLERAFPGELREGGMEGSDIKADVHTRRVLYRLGMAQRDTDPAAIAAARVLNPEHPGAIDQPLWYIGRTWCHATGPDCAACWLSDLCPRQGVDKRESVPARAASGSTHGTLPRRVAASGKYQVLAAYLAGQYQNADRLSMSFAEIESVLGRSLPKSARQYRAWWSNDDGSGSHSHARGWTDAGYRVDEVDLVAGQVTFARAAR